MAPARIGGCATRGLTVRQLKQPALYFRNNSAVFRILELSAALPWGIADHLLPWDVIFFSHRVRYNGGQRRIVTGLMRMYEVPRTLERELVGCLLLRSALDPRVQLALIRRSARRERARHYFTERIRWFLRRVPGVAHGCDISCTHVRKYEHLAQDQEASVVPHSGTSTPISGPRTMLSPPLGAPGPHWRHR